MTKLKTLTHIAIQVWLYISFTCYTFNMHITINLSKQKPLVINATYSVYHINISIANVKPYLTFLCVLYPDWIIVTLIII